MGIKRKFYNRVIVQPIFSCIKSIDWIICKLGFADVMATQVELATLFSSHIVSVPDSKFKLSFYAPSAMAHHRAISALKKEPETIAWIDSFEPNAVFWDVGANIGIFSVYALVRHTKLRVVAFEPSVGNIHHLVKNSKLNKVSDRITVIPLPLSDITTINEMKLSSDEVGGALNTFGVSYDYNGLEINSVDYSYQTLGLAADDYVRLSNDTLPNYIKIDVDGIEHLVISGLDETLKSNALSSILVEINESFSEHNDKCLALLAQHGFICVEKRHDSHYMAPGVSNFLFKRVGSSDIDLIE